MKLKLLSLISNQVILRTIRINIKISKCVKYKKSLNKNVLKN